MKYFLLNGPTASGKTTLMEYLLMENSDYLEPIVSFTTRSPRRGEKHGKDYYFITRQDYLELQRTGCIMEQIRYLDNFYGVTGAELQRVAQTRKNGLAIMTLEGIRKLKQNVGYQQVVSLFIYRDLAEIIQSIRELGYPDEEAARRIELAKRELRDIATCDHVVYNLGSLLQISQEMAAIIRKEINSQPFRCDIQVGQRYQHFSGEIVEIICQLAEHTETLSPMVIYRNLRSGKVYTRPYELFCGKKEWPPQRGKIVERFKLLEADASDHLP